MDRIAQVLLITAITGVGGLALGGGMAAALHTPSGRSVSLLLRFTVGVMLSVVCFDLIEDSLEGGALFLTVVWLLAGYLCTFLLNCWVDKSAHHDHDHGHSRDSGSVPHAHHGHHDNGKPCACGRHSLHTAGLVLAAAVALHNMPVGIAIGATFASSADARNGVLAALIIGLHNLPEGMSIAAPLLSGGSGAAGAVGIAALSGIPTIIGALIGYCVGAVGASVLSLSLAFAAGAMLYVIFGELLPEAEGLWRHRLSGFATLAGLLLGLALIHAH